MTNFTYDKNVPTPSHNPSTDVTTMQTNSQANGDIWDVDHVGFNAANGGTHLQTTFSSKNTPAAQTDPSSTLYTASGTASTVADVNFKNQNATYKINTLRAIGVFTTVNTNGAVALSNGFNVDSITSSSLGTVYTVALTPGAVTGTTVIVFTNLNNISSPPTWTYAANTLTLTVNNASPQNRILSFSVYQV